MFEVQHYTLCQGWINCWSDTTDGVSKPTTFATYEEAEAELKSYLKELLDEDMIDDYDEELEQYRIGETTDDN